MSEEVNILDLSDETLLNIFSYVTASDLYNLSLTSDRFNCIVRDRQLWNWCDGRPQPHSRKKVNFCLENLTTKTKAIFFDGNRNLNGRLVIYQDIETLKNYKELTILALENVFFHGDEVPMCTFPHSLEELSLGGSYITNHPLFFKSCHVLERLRVVILDRCRWFTSHALVSLSKLSSLQILSMYFCKQLRDEEMSYISLAGRFGFKSLQVLDLRFTGYGNEVVRSFYKNSQLNEFYFQSYPYSYFMDNKEWPLNFAEQVRDTDYKEVSKKFGDDYLYVQLNMLKLSDIGFSTHKQLDQSSSVDYVPCSSVLYQRPYRLCTSCTHKRWKQRKNNWYKQMLKPVDKIYLVAFSPKLMWIRERDPVSDVELSIIENMSATAISRINTPTGDPSECSVIVINLRGSSNESHNQPAVFYERMNRDREYELGDPEPYVPGANLPEFRLREFEKMMLSYANKPEIKVNEEILSDAEDDLKGKRKRKINGSSHKGAKRPKNEDINKPSCSKARDSENESDSDYSCSTQDLSDSDDGTKKKTFTLGPRLCCWQPLEQPLPNLPTRLKYISLRGYPKITDSTLRSLEHLQLLLLDVTHTKVTKEGLRQFLETNPSCHLIHESICSCQPQMHPTDRKYIH
ncbi:PREDICTED: uncharacterized protein LOC108566558 isoform X2 [Nicrophorus vespilloides]|uniref:Uncharacterized protein LOC108566558 isoform X2 n=1 Tax=Nicrophorus vespilloides TaxID=110193 RepID=A0ABM1N5A4_NICVS|nr:PREDICTED: uncharacterized protein LOC108566558 isoform X2 [Nicrophorus vespilloides]